MLNVRQESGLFEFFQSVYLFLNPVDGLWYFLDPLGVKCVYSLDFRLVAFEIFILHFGLSFFSLECQILSDFLKDGVVCLALFLKSFDFGG